MPQIDHNGIDGSAIRSFYHCPMLSASLYRAAASERVEIIIATNAVFLRITINRPHRFKTRKASCRWQTRATLAKRLHGLCKSNGVRSFVYLLNNKANRNIYSSQHTQSKTTRLVRALMATLIIGLQYVVSCIASLPIDSLHMVSYYRPIVTLCLKCTVFAQYRRVTDGQTDRHVAVAKTALA